MTKTQASSVLLIALPLKGPYLINRLFLFSTEFWAYYHLSCSHWLMIITNPWLFFNVFFIHLETIIISSLINQEYMITMIELINIHCGIFITWKILKGHIFWGILLWVFFLSISFLMSKIIRCCSLFNNSILKKKPHNIFHEHIFSLLMNKIVWKKNLWRLSFLPLYFVFNIKTICSMPGILIMVWSLYFLLKKNLLKLLNVPDEYFCLLS